MKFAILSMHKPLPTFRDPWRRGNSARKPAGKFAILSMHKPLPTFRAPDDAATRRGNAGEPAGKFAILSMHKPLPTFRACIRRSNSAEMLRIFCDGYYAQNVVNVPESINPGYIQIISWTWILKR